MVKRIILLFSGFLAVLIGLLVYYMFTSRNRTIIPVESGPPPLVNQVEGSPHFIDRDQYGNITREFGFEKRISDTGEEEAIDIDNIDIGSEGLLRISKPWARIHSKGGRIVEITADMGTVILEKPLSEGQIPTSGYLEQVSVKVYRSAGAGAVEPVESQQATSERPGAEFEVFLEGQVDFELEFSRLSCGGGVSVAAPTFAVEGTGLTLVYDQINERLEELEIRNIKQLMLASSATLFDSSTSTSPDRQVSEGGIPSQNNSEIDPAQMTTYRFSLTDQVEIVQPGGRERMLADAISLLTDVDLTQMGVTSVGSATDTGISRENMPETGGIWGSSFAVQEFQPTILDPNQAVLMTCKGPLVISLVEQAGITTAGNRLEMTATGGPVRIWRDGREAVQADQIVFDQIDKTIRMTASEDRPIRLDWDEQQWVTARRQVVFEQDAGQAVFTGSGEFSFADAKTEGPAHFRYQDRLNFMFVPDPNINEISLDHLEPKRLEITGGVEANYADNFFIADKISSDFARDPNGHYVPSTVFAEGEEGSLSLTNEADRYRVWGDRIEGDARVNIWTITGRPARVVRLDQPDKLEGPVIRADLGKKRFEITKPSTIQAQLKGDLFGSATGIPVDLQVVSNRGVYETETGQVELFDANCIIEQLDSTRKTTQLISPVITLGLTEVIKDIPVEPNLVETTTDIQLNSMKAHGGEVFILHHEYDPNTEFRLRSMEMLTQELTYDEPNQQLRAGPGWIVSQDYKAAKPGKTPSSQGSSVNAALPGLLGSRGPNRLMVQFGREMLFDKLKRDLTFAGGVVADYQPLVGDPEDPEIFIAEVADMRRLSCQELRLTFAEAGVEGSEPAQMGNLQRVLATGKVFTEATLSDGRTHFMAGENLEYDLATSTITMTGSFAQPAYLDEIPCSLIRWNVKDGTFVVKSIG